MLGVHWASGVVTPANPTYTAEELAYQLRDSGAKALATLAPLLPIAVQAADAAGISRDRIILLGDVRSPEFRHWREILDPSTTVKWRRGGRVKADKDLAYLVYSSGTTVRSLSLWSFAVLHESAGVEGTGDMRLANG